MTVIILTFIIKIVSIISSRFDSSISSIVTATNTTITMFLLSVTFPSHPYPSPLSSTPLALPPSLSPSKKQSEHHPEHHHHPDHHPIHHFELQKTNETVGLPFTVKGLGFRPLTWPTNPATPTCLT